MERIGVFCSSHSGLPASITEAATTLGAWIGREGKVLVYGGVNKGLMETLASAVKQNKGQVFGAIPDAMSQRGLLSPSVDIEFRCVDLNDRKSTLLREADIFVALPGGIGTLDEAFSVMASSIVGEHSKKVIFFSPNHFWQPLVSMIKSMERQGFAYPGTTERLLVADTMDEVIRMIESA